LPKIRISADLSQEDFEKYQELAEKEFSDKSKLLRKWINENYEKMESGIKK